MAWKGCIFSIQGDHEFYSNVLKLPHWASHYPCWECDCENFSGCDPKKSMKELDLEKSSCHVWSHAELAGRPLVWPSTLPAATCQCKECKRRPYAYPVLQGGSTPTSLGVSCTMLAGLKGLERFAKKSLGKGLGWSLKKSKRNTSPRACPIGWQIWSCQCSLTATSHGQVELLWI